MKKILFVGHDLKFAKFLIEYYSKQSEYEVKIDKWQGHNVHDEEYSKECLGWAEIIFCEWGLGNAVWYSRNKRPHQKLIVRMHAQERKTEYPNKFNYTNIHKIITISPFIYEEFYKIFKIPRDKMELIYNCVDTEKFNCADKIDSKYNLAIVGILPKLKRLDLCIDIIEKLYEEDKRYKLYIKGKMPEELQWIKRNEEENEYYTKLFERISKSKCKKNIIFEGHGDDIASWFNKIGFILSTSDFESYHLAVAEGMSTGAYPIVFNWRGSETIYEDKWIVKDVDGAVNKIKNISKQGYNVEEISNFIKKNYDQDKALMRYKEILI